MWKYVGTLKNLRKVSCSPWCNEEKAKRFIAIIREEIANHWKP